MHQAHRLKNEAEMQQKRSFQGWGEKKELKTLKHMSVWKIYYRWVKRLEKNSNKYINKANENKGN